MADFIYIVRTQDGIRKEGKIESKNLEFDPILIKKELNELITAGLSLSSASRYLAKKKNLGKNRIYNLH